MRAGSNIPPLSSLCATILLIVFVPSCVRAQDELVLQALKKLFNSIGEKSYYVDLVFSLEAVAESEMDPHVIDTLKSSYPQYPMMREGGVTSLARKQIDNFRASLGIKRREAYHLGMIVVKIEKNYNDKYPIPVDGLRDTILKGDLIKRLSGGKDAAKGATVEKNIKQGVSFLIFETTNEGNNDRKKQEKPRVKADIHLVFCVHDGEKTQVETKVIKVITYNPVGESLPDWKIRAEP